LLGCVSGAEITKVPEHNPITFTGSAKPVQFKRIVIKLNRGEVVGAEQVGLFCVGSQQLVWKGGHITIQDEEFTTACREELENAHYKVVGDPDVCLMILQNGKLSS